MVPRTGFPHGSTKTAGMRRDANRLDRSADGFEKIRIAPRGLRARTSSSQVVDRRRGSPISLRTSRIPRLEVTSAAPSKRFRVHGLSRCCRANSIRLEEVPILSDLKYPSLSMASSTRSRVFSATSLFPFITLETVAIETLARLATSAKVGFLPLWDGDFGLTAPPSIMDLTESL